MPDGARRIARDQVDFLARTGVMAAATSAA
jgi:hypothetical protein